MFRTDTANVTELLTAKECSLKQMHCEEVLPTLIWYLLRNSENHLVCTLPMLFAVATVMRVNITEQIIGIFRLTNLFIY